MPQSERRFVQKCIGYRYSLVLAVDMYATVFKDPLGAALGNVYKNKILLVGGSQDETESL
ncbi:hypothetical protein M405DRAFT_829163 [Rhizopogon salebrosus TDB-379]|nr:hypothetical protein M405DRAFT_829163 [Rhizopogon salebrosus TDB-379]